MVGPGGNGPLEEALQRHNRRASSGVGRGSRSLGKRLRFSYAIVKEVGKKEVNFFLKNGVTVKLFWQM